MTDPVILLGTQSNGETLPVQVDGFGRLVAEGLPGPEGPEGPSGGSFPLPADPYEGALLGWLNGELSWVGTPPVPIPPGVFGPITAWDAQSGLLTVEGEIPAAVGSGVYVWQCNQDGTYFTEGWNTSQVWSDYAVSNGAEPWSKAFDGVTSTEFNTYEATSNTSETPVVWTNTGTKPAFTKIEVWANRDYISEPSSGKITINNFDVSDQIAGNNPRWYEIDLTGASNTTTLESITLAGYNQATSGQGAGVMRLGAVRLDGRILVDSDLSLNLRVNSVLGQSLLGVPSATVDFTIGKYLKVPEQRVAPWVLYGNDPTSLIDHLRSS